MLIKKINYIYQENIMFAIPFAVSVEWPCIFTAPSTSRSSAFVISIESYCSEFDSFEYILQSNSRSL